MEQAIKQANDLLKAFPDDPFVYPIQQQLQEYINDNYAKETDNA